MFKATHKPSDSALLNLKMQAASTHYGEVLEGTKLGTFLNRALLPEEELNLSEELALTRHMAAEAAKDYATCLTIHEAKNSNTSMELLACACARLNVCLKDVKEMCESQSKMKSTISRMDVGMLNFGDILAYVMGVVNNNTPTTMDAENIESQLRLQFKELSSDSSDNSFISKPSDDKLIEQMDQSIPKVG